MVERKRRQLSKVTNIYFCIQHPTGKLVRDAISFTLQEFWLLPLERRLDHLKCDIFAAAVEYGASHLCHLAAGPAKWMVYDGIRDSVVRNDKPQNMFVIHWFHRNGGGWACSKRERYEFFIGDLPGWLCCGAEAVLITWRLHIFRRNLLRWNNSRAKAQFSPIKAHKINNHYASAWKPHWIILNGSITAFICMMTSYSGVEINVVGAPAAVLSTL